MYAVLTLDGRALISSDINIKKRKQSSWTLKGLEIIYKKENKCSRALTYFMILRTIHETKIYLINKALFSGPFFLMSIIVVY